MNGVLYLLIALFYLASCQGAPARSAPAAPAPNPVVVPSAPAPVPVPVATAETPPPKPPVPDYEAWLEYFDKRSGKRQVFPIQSGKVIRVGRASPDQAVPDVDLGQLTDGDTVSRRHAEIMQRDGTWMLFIQPDATNRSFLNKEIVERGSLTALKSGDEIQLGAVQVMFRTHEPPP